MTLHKCYVLSDFTCLFLQVINAAIIAKLQQKRNIKNATFKSKHPQVDAILAKRKKKMDAKRKQKQAKDKEKKKLKRQASAYAQIRERFAQFDFEPLPDGCGNDEQDLHKHCHCKCKFCDYKDKPAFAYSLKEHALGHTTSKQNCPICPICKWLLQLIPVNFIYLIRQNSK